MAFNAPESYGGFIYDIDKFTVTSGATTFVDDFDDGEEPPNGPNGLSTYFATPLSSDAESNGFLTLNSIDALVDEDEVFIDVFLVDHFTPGIGGSIEGIFNISNGITPNTGFRIEIVSPQTNGVSLFVESSSSGDVFASFTSEGNDQGVTESETDITNSLIGITDITLKLDISIQNVVTAFLDYGSDGVFDITLPGTGTLLGTANFAVGFGAEETTAVPEPTTIALLGIGLAGLTGGVVRRRFKRVRKEGV